MIGHMGSFEHHSDKHPLHDRIEQLEREIAQRDALLANQKELIMHLYKQIDGVPDSRLPQPIGR